MQKKSLTATAVEKLNRLAKRHRDETGKTLSESLDFVAQQAGYGNWKQVTVLFSLHTPALLPAKHNWKSHWFHDSTTPRQHKLTTVEELCEWLGGVEPVLLRSHCEKSKPGARCLCELDPFLTAKRAGVKIDIGDKYDFWNYLYLGDEPFRELNKWAVTTSMLGEVYIHEQQLFNSKDNDVRSNSLNPNNDAYKAGLDNRSNQLNPNNRLFNFDIGSAPHFPNDYSVKERPQDLSANEGYFQKTFGPTSDSGDHEEDGDVYWYSGIDD